MNRANERRAKLIEGGGTQPLLNAGRDSRLQLLGGSLGKRERDDRPRVGTPGQQVSDPLAFILAAASGVSMT